MNFRKFYFWVSCVISVFLFISGILLISTINVVSGAQAIPDGDTPSSALTNQPSIGNYPVNILVIGGDKVNRNADTMILVNYTPSDGKVNILSIPRDTRIRLNDTFYKINITYPVGKQELTAQMVRRLLRINIDYYVYLDTSVFRKMIDLVGGVYFDVPVDMKYTDASQGLYIDLKKGPQLLDGPKAEQFMRFRQPDVRPIPEEMLPYYDGSDTKRIQQQQKFIMEFIRQKLNLANLMKWKDLLEIVFSSLETNLSVNDVLSLSKNLLGFDMSKVATYTLYGEFQEGKPYYFIYKEQIKVSATGEIKPASSILDQEFKSRRSFVEDLALDAKIPIFISDEESSQNPSNTQSTMQSTQKYRP